MKYARHALPLYRTCACVAAIAVAASFMACSASSTLRVAASGDYAPFSSTTSYGAIVGFDASVAAQFAQDSEREMYFVRLTWPRLIEQAQSDGFDVAMSGVTVRADRVPHMAFSRPYAVTGAVAVVRRERAGVFDTLKQIDRLGVRIAVNRGGHLERVARARFDKATILTIDDNRMLADLLLRGEVDAVVSEQLEVRSWPADTFAVIGPFTRDRKAYAVPSQHIHLLQQLNPWLAARETDGWLNSERRRWLGEASTWTADAACFEAIAAAIDLRMDLMPQVAAAKRQRNLPIEDIARETEVLEQAAQWATAAGLDSDAAIVLFGKLIAAAKEVQRASIQDNLAVLSESDLDALREAITFYSRRIIDEAASCKAALTQSSSHPALEAALRGGDSALLRKLLPAAKIAALLADLADGQRGTVPGPAPIAAPPESNLPIGSYVEFCVPPNAKFDRQGYSAEPLLGDEPLFGGEPIAADPSVMPVHSFRSGRTRVPVEAGHYRYRLYVNGSSADPHGGAGARSSAAKVEIDVPPGGAIGIRYTPIIRPGGEIELRWGEPGAAPGPYSAITRFDAEIEIYDPTSSSPTSQCPW